MTFSVQFFLLLLTLTACANCQKRDLTEDKLKQFAGENLSAEVAQTLKLSERRNPLKGLAEINNDVHLGQLDNGVIANKLPPKSDQSLPSSSRLAAYNSLRKKVQAEVDDEDDARPSDRLLFAYNTLRRKTGQSPPSAERLSAYNAIQKKLKSSKLDTLVSAYNTVPRKDTEAAADSKLIAYNTAPKKLSASQLRAYNTIRRKVLEDNSVEINSSGDSEEK
ncbi:uncharacterized protein LOC106052954 [Biomphalaria glabrata]|uniref:Uncharacterized protein LOC106052954 n=1 Tax=Biomphalaria glabrata TaxID=6526 RepID=A0A9W2Z9J6_BIOGL|nr:uncharacterized protein LOC106052954 [Biomphalaria glabrata]